jgi:hypothetical protein
MATLNLIITTAGQAAIAQAGSLGPVVISKIAIGSGTWSVAPTPSATALNTQIKQLDPSGSETPSAGIIHITATDNSADVYSVYEMGLYTSTGILFAIAGGTTLFLTKATGSSSLFSIDLAITNVPSGSVVIGDAGFAYPPATETTQGVAEIATSAEVVAGTDDTRIVTPLKLASANFLSKSGGTVTGTLNVTGAVTSVTTCKAWAKFTATGATPSPVGYNIASVTYSNGAVVNGWHSWTVTFTSPMPSANYVINGTATWTSNLDGNSIGFVNVYSQTANGFTFTICSPAGYGGGHLSTTASSVYITVFSN